MIRVTYRSIDGFRAARSYKTLERARAFAVERVGAHPEIGSTYAVSGDGVGKVTVEGASLAELFGQTAAPLERPARYRCEADLLSDYPPPEADPFDGESYHAARRRGGCVCSVPQLDFVGCDCGAEDGAPLPRPDWSAMNRARASDPDEWGVPF